MDRDDNVPPPGEQQSAPPVLSYIESFKPLVPTEEMKSTSQHLQHIFVTNGSPASFGHVVSKQWRADSVNGRSTWAVVGTALEVELLRKALIDGVATDIPGHTIDSQFVTAPSSIKSLLGPVIVIITFEYLVTALSECLQPDRTWQWNVTFGNPTVVMNFGWGNMSFDMAFSCPLLARWIEDTIQTGPQVVMACTVSSDNRPYFGREWREVAMQEITTLRRGASRMLHFRGYKACEGVERDNSFRDIEKSLKDISDNGAQADGYRTLLVADPTTVNMLPEVARPLLADKIERLHGNNAANIALDSKMTYVGQVSRVSDVVIFPYITGSIYDMGQTVCGADECGVPRSQAEINYYSRFNQESDIQPRVRLLASEDHFRGLPVHCETSAAHSQHLIRLLVCCKLVWPDVPLADIPVLLPADEAAVIYHMGHLCPKGIMSRPAELPGERDRPGTGEKQDLYRMMTLTRSGHTTATILMMGVQSLHSAHLLAQLSEEMTHNVSLDQNSKAVVEAVFALAVLTELNKNGATLLNRVTLMHRNQSEHKLWYKQNFKGIAEGKAGRGSIWLATGLWQMLMKRYDLRGPLDFCQRRPPPPGEISLNDGRISVDVLLTLRWDRRMKAFNKICTSVLDLGPVLTLTETPLTGKELLAVEVALVRAFMDRIMMVENHGEDFKAWDMASGHEIGRPFDSQEAQIWWEDCSAGDALLSGERCPVIFCVYSYLVYELSADRRTLIRKAVDATFVSARSVRIAFEGTDLALHVRTHTGNLQLLKERASQASGGGQ